jgi:hypothetical protein
MNEPLQLNLDTWRPPVVAPHASEQDQQLARVESVFAEPIIGWVHKRLAAGAPRFHLVELEEDIKAQLPGAPGSPARILRLLRQHGHISYRVINRARSHYEPEATP